MKLELLVVAVFVIGLGTAYAEQGKNYDRELLSIENGIAAYKWSSHYERIDDGSNWVNYIQTENATHFIFESANISVVFDKSGCNFELFEPGHIKFSNQTVARIEKDIIVNSVQDSLSCEFSKEGTGDGYTINTKQSGSDYEVHTLFEITASGFLEWTYEPDNHNIMNSKNFTIIERCPNCEIFNIDADKIHLDDYTYDSKNFTHGALKLVNLAQNEVVFEKPSVGIFDEPKIDPVFSSNNPTEDSEVRSASATGIPCPTTPYTKQAALTTLSVWVPITSDSNPCVRGYFQFDTSSLPSNSIIISTSLTTEIASLIGTARNCDVVGLTTAPTTQTAEDVFNSIGSAGVLLDNNPYCAVTGTNRILNLGDTGAQYIQDQLDDGFVALGVKLDDETRDAVSNYGVTFCAEEGACTPDPTLTILYLDTVNFLPETDTGITIVGDVARIAPSQILNVTGMNVTGMDILVNGTVWKTNSTVFNFTSWPSTITYDPFWFQMDPQGYEFEVQVETDPQPNFRPANMLSYFTFDETNSTAGLGDIGSEGNDASVGAGTYNSTAGMINNSTGLDGVTYYTVPNESDYDFNNIDAFSVMVWVYPQTGITNNDVVFAKDANVNVASTAGYSSTFLTTNPHVEFRIQDGSTAFVVVSPNDSVPLDTWTHLAYTFDGSQNQNGMKIYVNGELSNTGTSSTISNPITNNEFLTLVAQPGGARIMEGGIDDFRILDRESSPTEIKQIFNLGTQKISNLETTTQEYNPDYNTAVNPTLGNVNYTVSRINSQDTILLKVNRDVNDTTFTINCRVRDSVQTAFNSTQAVWQNRTLVGYGNLTFDGFATSHAYGQCQNPPGDLFDFTSFADTTLSLAAINVFDSSFGQMIGVPVGVFFVVMAAAMANKRTAPTFIIVITAIAGAMATIGFFTLEPIVWGLALVSAMLGLFVNQKIF